MKRIKRIIVLVVAILMVVSFSACSQATTPGESGSESTDTTGQSSDIAEKTDGTETAQVSETTGSAGGTYTSFDAYIHPNVESDGNLKVGVIHNTLNYESTIRSIQRAKIECAYRGWEYVDGEYADPAEIREIWQTMINVGCNAIILHVVDNYSSYGDLIKQCREAGIGVYGNDNGVVDGIISNVTLPGGMVAAELAYKLGDMYSFDANVCILYAEGAQVHKERAYGFKGIIDAYPNYELLDFQDTGSANDSIQNCYDYTQAWLQEYGDDIDIIFGSCDTFAMIAAEAITASGGDYDIVTAGVDGANDSFAAMNDPSSAFAMCYAQPVEGFMHTTFEIVNDIQVKGLNPGDTDCTIGRAGQTIYMTGNIITRDNMPKVGDSMHSLFSYYTSPDDPDAWYNWEPEGFEIYKVEY